MKDTKPNLFEFLVVNQSALVGDAALHPKDMFTAAGV
jgi:hypothetical protein